MQEDRESDEMKEQLGVVDLDPIRHSSNLWVIFPKERLNSKKN